VDYGARSAQYQVVPNLNRQRRDPALLALGRALRDVRLEHGISQEALAHISGVDRSYVGRIERGDNNIAVLTLLRLVQPLGVTPSALLAKAGL
jgi:transcriptional regulator with XRE-family HTH domain